MELFFVRKSDTEVEILAVEGESFDLGELRKISGVAEWRLVKCNGRFTHMPSVRIELRSSCLSPLKCVCLGRSG